MNKRIAKKFEKRLWIRSCREYREKIEKPYKEYLRCLKRPMTEEEKYWDEFAGFYDFNCII